jgi:hypothetical protein
MLAATGSTNSAAMSDPKRSNASSTARSSLKGTTTVSATVPSVTPADPGRPSVATPLPAATSSASTWPW